MRFEADGDAFGTPGEALKLVDGLAVGRYIVAQAVVQVADVFIEGARVFFIQYFGQAFQRNRFALALLFLGVLHQCLGFLLYRLFFQSCGINVVAESAQQCAGIGRRIAVFFGM